MAASPAGSRSAGPAVRPRYVRAGQSGSPDARRPGGRASALSVGTCPLESYSDQHSLFAAHPLAIVVPVGVLIGKALVIVDERVHRLGKRENLGLALGVNPAADEALGEDAELRPGVPSQVDDLVGGLATG